MIIDNTKDLIRLLQKQQLGIIPTDTIYGFCCLWQDEKNIEKIFLIKKRSFKKPLLILVASFDQLSLFVDITMPMKDFFRSLKTPTTVVLPLKQNFEHRFWKQTVAIRFVTWPWLKKILLATGPLVSTSCNFSKQKPIVEFQKLLKFQNMVDFIFQKPTQSKKSSIIIDWTTKKRIR